MILICICVVINAIYARFFLRKKVLEGGGEYDVTKVREKVSEIGAGVGRLLQ